MALSTTSCHPSCTEIHSTWKSSSCRLQSQSWLRKWTHACPDVLSSLFSPSRLSIVSVSDVVPARNPFPRAKSTVNRNIKVSINWNSNAHCNPLPKNVSVVVVPHCACWTPIGSLKMRHSNSTKWFWSIHVWKVFVVMPVSTGFVEQTRNTENYAVWPPPDASPVDSVMAIVIPWPPVVHAENAGNASNNSVFADTVRRHQRQHDVRNWSDFLLFILVVVVCCFLSVDREKNDERRSKLLKQPLTEVLDLKDMPPSKSPAVFVFLSIRNRWEEEQFTIYGYIHDEEEEEEVENANRNLGMTCKRSFERESQLVSHWIPKDRLGLRRMKLNIRLWLIEIAFIIWTRMMTAMSSASAVGTSIEITTGLDILILESVMSNTMRCEDSL